MLRLSLFVATFLLIYAGMHLVVWFGVRPLLAGRPQGALLLGLFMVVMVLAPVGVRLLDRAGLESAGRLLSLVGYSWMGFLFLAFAAFCAIYAWDLAIFGLARFFPAAGGWLLYGPKTALAVLLLVAAAGSYGFLEARNLRVERIRLESSRLPADRDRLRIVQVSDLHLGLINRQSFLRRVARTIGPLQPDLLIASGDIVDAQINHLDGLAEIFAAIPAPLGKFAVIGNHEVYAGLGQATDFITRSGFELLRNQAVTPVPGLRIVGVDDPATGESADEGALLSPLPREDFVLLLKHRPWIAEGSPGRFDLQLSGHAHRGQIFPFNYVTGIPYPRQDGLYPLAGKSRLYTSRGTGTWGPPMRLDSPPEIPVIDLVRPAAPAAP